jgi:integrase
MQVYRRQRNSANYSMRKRVPKRYAEVEPRAFVACGLNTDNAHLARMKAEAIWLEMVEGWEAALAMRSEDAARRFKAATEIAQRRGFAYLPAAEVQPLPTVEIVERVEAIADAQGDPDLEEADALLGQVERPALTVSAALDDYWTLAADRKLGKSPDQVRRWENPRKKAVRNFIACIGDLPLDDLGRAEFLTFRDWLLSRVQDGQFTAASANKDLIHLGDVLRTVDELRGLGLDFPMHKLALKQADTGKRPPFSRAWIADKLLAPGALDGLNAEAAGILRLMVNTGCRPLEVANLTAETIRLDCPVPHIDIQADGRQLKSKNAARTIPLLGASLDAARANREGFPRYRASPATVSATVNSYLEENGLKESPRHTLYSLRHAFEDRMLAAGVDERVRRDFMGHALGRERYGAGASLAHAAEMLAPVAI